PGELLEMRRELGLELPGEVLAEQPAQAPARHRDRRDDPCRGSRQQPQSQRPAPALGKAPAPAHVESRSRSPRPRTVSIMPGGSFLRRRATNTSMVLESRSKSCA